MYFQQYFCLFGFYLEIRFLNYYLCISNLIKYTLILFLKTQDLSIPKGQKKVCNFISKLYQNNIKTGRKNVCEWLSKIVINQYHKSKTFSFDKTCN